MSSSQEKEATVPDSRTAMDADLFMAAINGDSDVLIRRLGLPTDAQNEIQITIEASSPNSQQTKAEHHVAESELGSIATGFGDTLLHLLITGRHNELSLKVFRKDMSLLNARNNNLETPLHNAAKVENEEIIRDLIRLSPSVVKGALGETNENGDTALHVAANHNHKEVVSELMRLDPEAAYKKNKEGFSPLYIAIVEGHTSLVKAMLQVDATLACTQFSDGTFPVHVAARRGNEDLVKHFIQKYPDYAKLLDSCGRNLIHHMAAEENHSKELTKVFELTKDDLPQICKMVESMINARDYEGNTPLHMAATKGHESVMMAILDKLNYDREALVQNQKGKTAFDLSYDQLLHTTTDLVDHIKINQYVEKQEGWYFTPEWFLDVMPSIPNKMERNETPERMERNEIPERTERNEIAKRTERVQFIGLGSVLITTVAFTAAFTIPGGYNADNGTPVLGKRFVFKAFIFANTLAFVHAFQSLFIIISYAIEDLQFEEIEFAAFKFYSAANCMMIAFGLGSYVILAPVSLPIAIIILVVGVLLGSTTVMPLNIMQQLLYQAATNRLSTLPFILGIVTIRLMSIFCPAFL